MRDIGGDAIVAGLAPPEGLRVGAPLGVGVERAVDKVDARALEGVQVHLGLGFRAGFRARVRVGVRVRVRVRG